MLRLSKKLMFAIEAVLDIAYNSGTKAVQSRDINCRQGIPRRYLEPVLQELVRANILRGVRGLHGGYRMACERRTITLAKIAEAVRITEAPDSAFDTPAGSRLGEEIVRPLCLDLITRWDKELEKITIEDLYQRARVNGVESVTALRPHGI